MIDKASKSQNRHPAPANSEIWHTPRILLGMINATTSQRIRVYKFSPIFGGQGWNFFLD